MKNKKMKFTVLLFTLLLAGTIARSQSNGAANWRGPQTLQQLAAAPVALIPFPQQAQWTKDPFLLKQNIVITYAENDAVAVANAVRSLTELLAVNGITTKQEALKPGNLSSGNNIQLRINKKLPLKDEAYSLQIDIKKVLQTAKDAAV